MDTKNLRQSTPSRSDGDSPKSPELRHKVDAPKQSLVFENPIASELTMESQQIKSVFSADTFIRRADPYLEGEGEEEGQRNSTGNSFLSDGNRIVDDVCEDEIQQSDTFGTKVSDGTALSPPNSDPNNTFSHSIHSTRDQNSKKFVQDVTEKLEQKMKIEDDRRIQIDQHQADFDSSIFQTGVQQDNEEDDFLDVGSRGITMNRQGRYSSGVDVEVDNEKLDQQRIVQASDPMRSSFSDGTRTPNQFFEQRDFIPRQYGQPLNVFSPTHQYQNQIGQQLNSGPSSGGGPLSNSTDEENMANQPPIMIPHQNMGQQWQFASPQSAGMAHQNIGYSNNGQQHYQNDYPNSGQGMPSGDQYYDQTNSNNLAAKQFFNSPPPRAVIPPRQLLANTPQRSSGNASSLQKWNRRERPVRLARRASGGFYRVRGCAKPSQCWNAPANPTTVSTSRTRGSSSSRHRRWLCFVAPCGGVRCRCVESAASASPQGRGNVVQA